MSFWNQHPSWIWSFQRVKCKKKYNNFCYCTKSVPTLKKNNQKVKNKARFYSFQRDTRPTAVHVIKFYSANRIFGKPIYISDWNSDQNPSRILLWSAWKEEPKYSKNSYQNFNQKNTWFGFFCTCLHGIHIMYDTKLLKYNWS